MALIPIGGDIKAQALNNNFSYLNMQMTQKDELPFVNVRFEGAVGDGVIDDAGALQTAINKAISLDKELIIPAGVYNLGSWTDFDLQNDIIIRGDGKESTRLIIPEGNRFLRPQNNVNVHIEGVSFEGSQNVIGIAGDVKRLVLKDVGFYDGYVMVQEVTEGVKIKKLQLNDIEAEPVYGVVHLHTINIDRAIIDGVESDGGIRVIRIGNNTNEQQPFVRNIDIRHCKIINASRDDPGEVQGILIYGTGVTIEYNYLENITGYDGDCEGIYTKVVNGLISRNILINAGQDESAINIKGRLLSDPDQSTPNSYGMICESNIITFDDDHQYTITRGINIQAEDCQVRNNTISGTTFEGIKVHLGSGDNIHIIGNKVKSIQGTSTSTTAAISVDAGSNHQIKDNEITNIVGTQGHAAGIAVRNRTGETTSNIVVAGNVIDGIGTWGGLPMAFSVGVGNTANLDDVTFRDNITKNVSNIFRNESAQTTRRLRIYDNEAYSFTNFFSSDSTTDNISKLQGNVGYDGDGI